MHINKQLELFPKLNYYLLYMRGSSFFNAAWSFNKSLIFCVIWSWHCHCLCVQMIVAGRPAALSWNPAMFKRQTVSLLCTPYSVLLSTSTHVKPTFLLLSHQKAQCKQNPTVTPAPRPLGRLAGEYFKVNMNSFWSWSYFIHSSF